MRVYLTGASGFVGSNLAAVFAERGAELDCPSHAEVDLTDRAAVLRSVADARRGLDDQLARLRHEMEDATCRTT